uniref:Uncharacterized protein n=1 Tax=Solanum tuberosum TaxID=4113 RepID=M0ZM89_SOLTU
MLVLVIVLLLLQQIQHTSANVLFGKLRKKEWLKFTSMQNDHVDSQIFEKNHERGKKEESKELVDVEDEIAKLLTKDYIGRSKPRRSKPPINNHKPTD